jgi:hypothetical protein
MSEGHNQTDRAAWQAALCLLCVASGVLIGHLLPTGTAALATLGALAAASAMLRLCAAYGQSRRSDRRLRSGRLHERTAPRLGQMLMHYGLISEGDLQKALARQRTGEKRLGQVMLEMQLITPDQLLEVLEEQASRRDHASRHRLRWAD